MNILIVLLCLATGVALMLAFESAWHAKRAADAATKIKDQVFTTLAHEMRRPLQLNIESPISLRLVSKKKKVGKGVSALLRDVPDKVRETVRQQVGLPPKTGNALIDHPVRTDSIQPGKLYQPRNK